MLSTFERQPKLVLANFIHWRSNMAPGLDRERPRMENLRTAANTQRPGKKPMMSGKSIPNYNVGLYCRGEDC